MIGIIEYGMGNLGSVQQAARAWGLEFCVLSRPTALDSVSTLILPGVGAFGDGMRYLHERGWADALRDWIARGRPLFGICLGLQLLFETSEEAPGVSGLGVLRGHVRRLRVPPPFKVPHMGWNRVWQVREDPLWQGIPDGTHFYFVHSYLVEPTDPDSVVGRTTYGESFCSAVHAGAVVAVQFHPEKSQRFGLQLFANALRMVGESPSWTR